MLKGSRGLWIAALLLAPCGGAWAEPEDWQAKGRAALARARALAPDAGRASLNLYPTPHTVRMNAGFLGSDSIFARNRLM